MGWKFIWTAEPNDKVQTYKKYKSTKMKLSITRSIFELHTPDFAWKFVWIVLTNYKSTKVQKKYISTKVLLTQPFFELQTPDFAWTVEPNDKVQKYKKYHKSTKMKLSITPSIFE